MKKLLAIFLAFILFIPTASALAPDIGDLSVAELLDLREAIDNRLRELGYYPYIELQKNDQGEEVAVLQARLAELGYYKENVTGKYDSNTVTAVKAFEKANKLKQDGVATIDDQMLLFGTVASVSAASNQSAKSSAKSTESKSTESKAVYVWIPKSGSKYHRKESCSKMKDPKRVTLESAKSSGYTACSKCNPPK